MKQSIVLATLIVTTLIACGERMTVTERLRAQLDPRVGTYIVNAQRAYEAGNYNLALAWTDSAEVAVPELADIHFLRGVIYTALNRLDIAKAAYETTIELDPEYKGARFNLGLNEFRRGRLREAVDLYKAEEGLGSTSALYHEMGRAYAQMGEADSAETAYLQALELDSTNATAVMWLGQLYEELGELEKAIDYSKRGLRLRPENEDYKYIIGSLLNRTGQSQEAYDMLKPVADARPWHHGAQFNLGQVLMAMGREDEAQGYFVRADSAQQLQQKINEAEQDINQSPDSLLAWTALSDLLRKAGQFDRAIEGYRVAVSLDPWNFYLQNNLAMLMMESGDLDGAARRFRAIVNIDSTLTDVWYNLGVAYANSGQYDQARDAWQRVARQQPGNAAVKENLARLEQMAAEATQTRRQSSQ